MIKERFIKKFTSNKHHIELESNVYKGISIISKTIGIETEDYVADLKIAYKLDRYGDISESFIFHSYFCFEEEEIELNQDQLNQLEESITFYV